MSIYVCVNRIHLNNWAYSDIIIYSEVFVDKTLFRLITSQQLIWLSENDFQKFIEWFMCEVYCLCVRFDWQTDLKCFCIPSNSQNQNIFMSPFLIKTLIYSFWFRLHFYGRVFGYSTQNKKFLLYKSDIICFVSVILKWKSKGSPNQLQQNQKPKDQPKKVRHTQAGQTVAAGQ